MGQVNYGAQRAVVALASATSANGTARNGATLPLNFVHPGTLCLQVSVTIVTGSVVATIKHQVSQDGTTWYDLHNAENVAYVTIAATATVALAAPTATSAFKFYRAVATLSGASTASGDLTAVTYRSLTADELFV